MEVAGPFAQRLALEAESDEDAIGPDWAGVATGVYLNNRKVTIYGGTSEVQHNILAKAVLGSLRRRTVRLEVRPSCPRRRASSTPQRL